jgi:hypothetical protein
VGEETTTFQGETIMTSTLETHVATESLSTEDQIKAAVFDKMGGKPSNFRSMRVANVFDDSYRITIYCEVKADTLIGYRIEPSSYFLTLKDGVIEFKRS